MVSTSEMMQQIHLRIGYLEVIQPWIYEINWVKMFDQLPKIVVPLVPHSGPRHISCFFVLGDQRITIERSVSDDGLNGRYSKTIHINIGKLMIGHL